MIRFLQCILCFLRLPGSRLPLSACLRAAFVLAATVPMLGVSRCGEAQGKGYLHTSGSQILDSSNSPVRITGVNWYGFETTDEVAHGLYAQDYHQILSAIRAQGYNTIRIPFSNQMVEAPIRPQGVAYYNAKGPINSDLAGLNALQIMDRIIAASGASGLKVVLVNHRSEAGNDNEPSGLWYTPAYPEAKWIADWQFLVNRYKSVLDSSGNAIVVAVDLRNEPHLLTQTGDRTGACWTGDSSTAGCPLTNSAQNWPAAATRAAKAVLTINPGLLIAVEGTDCYSGDCGWQGGNLEGAAAYPIQLPVPNRLVYSAHDYGPLLHKQSWFNASTTPASLEAAWTRYWAYLSKSNLAPVWVGEFGTTNLSTDLRSNAAGSQGQWFSSLIAFFASQPNLHWTYWAANGEDKFGLLDAAYDAVPPSSLKQQMLSSIQGKPGPIPPPPACSSSPSAPVGLTGSASANAIQLGWTAVPTPAGCTVTYSLYRSTTTGFVPAPANLVVAGLTSPAFTDSTVSVGTPYFYRVVSVDSHGSSAASQQVAASIPRKSMISVCHVTYNVASQWPGGFQAAITIQNNGSDPINNWTLQWTFPSGQSISSLWNGTVTQSGASVTVKNQGYNSTIPPGSSVTGIGFTAALSGTQNLSPASFAVNGVSCR